MRGGPAQNTHTQARCEQDTAQADVAAWPVTCSPRPWGKSASRASDRGTARFASTRRASIVWGSLDNATSTLCGSWKVMKPKPRDRRDTGSFITTASWTAP